MNNAGIRIHSGSGGSIHSRNNWTPRTSITTYNGPHTFGSNNHWHDQLVQNLVQTPKFHIYAPNTIGDYNLRLRSQLMLPPKHTGFLLIPNHPNDCDRHIALHILLRRIHLPHYACIGFVSLPEAIFHAHHTVNYSVTIRAIRMDGECKDLQDLSTVTGCVAHGIDSDSSTCRHAVSLGLFVYHPSGPQRDRLTRQYPTGLSTHDLTVPIPGWTPPPPDEDMSPDRELHTTARDWAESMNMSSQLVIHTSQWMMGFHPFFLDNPNTITSLQAPHTDYLFLSHSTLATHRPRINRNRTRYGAVFPSLLDALIYASRHDDTNHITLLHKDDCVLIDPNQDPLTNPIVMPSRITEELSSRPDCGIMALRLDSLSVAHSTAHIAPLLLNNLRPLTCAPHDATMVSIPIGDYTFSLMSICDAFEWMGHTALLRAPCKSGPIRTICDASLQKQVHPTSTPPILANTLKEIPPLITT